MAKQDSESPVAESPVADAPAVVHEAPTFTRLGTLSELTRGPNPFATDDGMGGTNGDEGSGL